MVACAFHSSTGKCRQEDCCEFKTNLCCIVNFIQSELQSEFCCFSPSIMEKKQKAIDEK